MSKTICVLGMGYMGLPISALFANQGFTVLGVDINPSRLEDIRKGRISSCEPRLLELSQKVLKNKSLLLSGLPDTSDVYIIAVPSPLNGHKKADLSFARNAARMVKPLLKKGDLVIVETTVVPGTCKEVILPILEQSNLLAGRDFSLAFCPERAIPGKTVYEIINNDRIIGGLNKKSADVTKRLYSYIVKGKISLTDLNTAEMVKIMENTARDVNIALANEFALICEKIGVDFWKAREFANRHPRVNILNAGPGVGGHCVPIDPWFVNIPEAKIMRTSREINDEMPTHIVKLLKPLLQNIPNPKVTILGVAYKANVDDTRESPAKRIIEKMLKIGWDVSAFDPIVSKPDFTQLSDLGRAVNKSDCILLVTDHEDFKNIDPNIISKKMRHKIVFDSRNCLDHNKWQSHGFAVHTLGDGSNNKLW